MQKERQNNIFSALYWREAARQLKDVRMITVAALIVALRIAVKFLKIQIAPGLNISLDGYVNSLGSVIYGPVVGLVVGAISDTLGCLVTGRMGEYFPPFALVEMSSSFIFALFFWKRKINFKRTLTAKFTVNLVSNIILTSIFNKWMYFLYYGLERAQAYNIINGARIVKNLVMFPLEATLIVTIFTFALPVLSRLKLVDKNLCYLEKPSTKRLVIELVGFTALSVALILFYVFFLKDFVSGLNIKIW
ncbi:MAG: folate family ECF transporter S component [Clostridia bacterium]|nr:folate family ECF transporter S component [Clostridia bacterium]